MRSAFPTSVLCPLSPWRSVRSRSRSASSRRSSLASFVSPMHHLPPIRALRTSCLALRQGRQPPTAVEFHETLRDVGTEGLSHLFRTGCTALGNGVLQRP